jgi:hypothetical protein
MRAANVKSIIGRFRCLQWQYGRSNEYLTLEIQTKVRTTFVAQKRFPG